MTFKEIAMKSQHTLKKSLMSELTRIGYRTRTKKGFLYAKGSLPVMLVAHLDTVHRKSVETICYSQDGNIVMSPEGIGGDDRAGVFMILQIIKKHRCHVLFCEDEEAGGIGARAFVASDIKPDIKYIIELDRRGSNDAVFYDCDNSKFTKFITGFGFKEEFGSFSDISIIAPELGVAAANISSGFYCEHTRHEYVDLNVMADNIERVGKIVSTKTVKFDYIESIRPFRSLMGGRYYEDFIDFGRYHRMLGDANIKPLMLIPESSYIKMPEGDMVDNLDQYFVDDAGRVFEYLYDLDVAVEAAGYEAFTENGLPVRFRPKDAREVEVVPLEYAIDLAEAYMFCDMNDDDDL